MLQKTFRFYDSAQIKRHTSSIFDGCTTTGFPTQSWNLAFLQRSKQGSVKISNLGLKKVHFLSAQETCFERVLH